MAKTYTSQVVTVQYTDTEQFPAKKWDIDVYKDGSPVTAMQVHDITSEDLMNKTIGDMIRTNSQIRVVTTRPWDQLTVTEYAVDVPS